MATTSDFKNGLCILHAGEIYMIRSFQHVKPGKGGAYYRTKLQNIRKSKLIEHTFNVGSRIETVRLEQHPGQFSYTNQGRYYFMDNSNFETVELAKEQIEQVKLMKEGQEVTLLFYEEQATFLSAQLPPAVLLRVTYTEPAIKGDTVNRALKKVVLETGAELQAPLFIQTGDLLKIDTRTCSYIERVKRSENL